MSSDDELESLARLAGIETGYEDAWGERQRLSSSRIRALLSLLRVPADGDPRAALRTLKERSWQRPLPPVHVVRERHAIEIPVVLPQSGEAASIAWKVTEESGRTHDGSIQLNELPRTETRDLGGCRLQRRLLRLPLLLPPGYHSLRLGGTARAVPKCEMQLVIVPPKCYLPATLESGNKTSGFAVQLYALRSDRNWGIGDFTDLLRLVDAAHALGAGVIGLNPLHASFLAVPARASPYAPSSRMFLNALYLDVEAVADFSESDLAQERVGSPAFQDQLRSLRAEPLVDYARVAHCKLDVLGLLYRSFVERHLGEGTAEPVSERGRAFRLFQARGGERLALVTTFEALSEHFGASGADPGNWENWPEGFRRPDTREVQDFIRRTAKRIEFFQYLQWLTEGQLAAVAARCEELRMAAGLYLDLAIGVAEDGADVWADQEAYVAGAHVGAPPDIWNPLGQDWGLPPLHPDVLRERAYSPFVEVLRANMRHAGALRIDHVVALLHLYWIAADRGPAEGGYVRYPLEDLLGVVALESHRNRCLIVGEDLGTVPRSFKRRLQRCGIFSYKLLYFEQDEKGAFLSPADYPALALGTVTTHDLPTLPGYWAAHDLALRADLGLFPSEDAERAAFEQRRRDRAALLASLAAEGLSQASDPDEFGPDLAEAVYTFLGRSPCKIVMVQLEDVLGVIDQPNLPGTTDEHPNWRRKLPSNLDEILQDHRLVTLARRLRAIRGHHEIPGLSAP